VPVKSSFLKVGENEFRGIFFIFNRGEYLNLINILNIEDYLKGVLPYELSPSIYGELEALKAQAVASRTYALYQAEHRRHWQYDLVANESDQMYKGVSIETRKTDRAVSETEGMVLMEREKPILAMYTANNGGYSADAGYMFNIEKKYLVAKPDPDSLLGKKSRWSRSFYEKEILSKLRRYGVLSSDIQEILPYKYSPSGRIIKVKLITYRKNYILNTWTTLRRALKLPEILFRIKHVGKKYIFEGKGWGHGVGYSQWGAALKGKKGFSFKAILQFYYPNTELKKLW
jgi:stage II sporulation protein D